MTSKYKKLIWIVNECPNCGIKSESKPAKWNYDKDELKNTKEVCTSLEICIHNLKLNYDYLKSDIDKILYHLNMDDDNN